MDHAGKAPGIGKADVEKWIRPISVRAVVVRFVEDGMNLNMKERICML